MMLPYLELPLCIGYGEGHEEKVVVAKFQPARITAYHEGYYPEVGMFIYQDSQPFQIALTMADYEDKIQAYWNMLANQANAQNEKKSIKQKLGIVN